MLFDLFASVDFSHNNFETRSPFEGIPPYEQLNFSEKTHHSAFARVSTLSKHAQHQQAFSSKTLEVYLFGYCFPRLENTAQPSGSQLTASKIAQLYQQSGERLVDQIKGSFALLIIDLEQQTVRAFTDPFNVRPLYYCQLDARLIVSTTLGAIGHYLQRHHQPPEIYYPAVLAYHLFEYPLDQHTILASVYSMPPGGQLQFSPQGLEVSHYWQAMQQLNDFSIQYSEEDSIARLQTVLKKNLSQHLFAPERTAVALTGGYDSRLNLALLGAEGRKFQYYSYGIADTYDLAIPQRIAQTQGLRFESIYLDGDYLQQFNENAELAISLGDGIAEANRANYLYAFRRLSARFDYILTGLFGSELIKHPTSVGNFVTLDMQRLLRSDRPEVYLDGLLDRAEQAQIIQLDIFRQYREAVKEQVLSNPYVINEHPFPVKYFYFLLMVGIRQYFMKEIKVERPFVENLHPFLDLDFVETLLHTPFPWVHHWQGEKNLRKSIMSHKLYVELIHRNHPALSALLSTHGYTPRYLLNPLTLPLMSLQYLYYKEKIKARSSFNSLEPIWQYLGELPPEESFYQRHKVENDARYQRDRIKLASLQHWLRINKITDSQIVS